MAVLDLSSRVRRLLQRVLARSVSSPWSRRRLVREKALPLEESLYQDGLGLDSLGAAEFSARLEEAFGSDPYTAGSFPRTLGDVVKFYEKRRPSPPRPQRRARR